MPSSCQPSHIEKRDIHFAAAQCVSPTWMDGDPQRTAYCDALSILFPDGERFFIKSVLHYLPQIEDPKLREEVRAFAAQEALHTREHERFNEALGATGLDVEALQRRAADPLRRTKSPLKCIAVTVAIEHLTATLANLVLNDHRIFASAPPALRDMWTWHAMEEMEHKGVAFDVFVYVTRGMPQWKRYALRCGALAVATRVLHRVHFANFKDILAARGYATDWRMWINGALWFMFVSPGYYRRSVPYYLSFFRPGFHPWDVDERPLARKWLAHFKNMTQKDSVPGESF